MRAGSQGSVLTPKPPTSSLDSRKRAAPLDQHRTRFDKKPRLDAIQGRADKENARPSNSGGVKDEQRMMDDLMAGLDASMFDGLDSSPVNSQKQRLSQLSPLKPKSQLKTGARSPSGTAARALAPSRPLVSESDNAQNVTSPSVKLRAPAFKPIKAEPPKPISTRDPTAGTPRLDKKDVKEDVASIKAERPLPVTTLEQKPIIQIDNKQDIKVRVEDVKPDLEDEEDFSFDFDLDDFACMDEDLLLKPHSAAQVRVLSDICVVM